MYKHAEYPKMLYPEGVVVKSKEEEDSIRGVVKQEEKQESVPAVAKHKQYRRQ